MPTKPAIFLSAALLLASSFAALAQRTPTNPALKYEAAIATFEADDKKTPPPQNAVLFTGSSSIVKWKTLAKDFPNVPTLNRGFGGSVISDSVYYANRTVIPYHPRRIVFYAGDNDIAAGKTPQAVAGDWQAFVEKTRAALPDVPLVFISLKPSPSRWKLHTKVEETNRLIAGYCAHQKAIDFVDVYHPMLGSDGKPPLDLFVADKLHMTPKGYAIWAKVLAPYVR